MTRMEITEYLGELEHSGISGVSRVRKLTAIREYFPFIEGEGAIAKSPAAGFGTPMKDRCRSAYLWPGEYTKLLSLAGHA